MPHVPRARRSTRRQTILVCVWGAYLVALVAGVLGLASLFAATGTAALGALLLAGLLVAVAGALWALDASETRRLPVAQVTPLVPSARQHGAVFSAQRSVAR